MTLRILCIIPARGGSKRLPRKNIHSFLGKPLMTWSIEACKNSKYLNEDNIYVSSEDDEILDIALNNEVNIIRRPISLSGDTVWTQEVLKHAVDCLDRNNEIDIIVRVQANSPQIKPSKIDECIEKLLDHNLWEVFTVNQLGIEDAAIHVMRRSCVNQNALSVYKGVVDTNYTDVHTIEDLKIVEKLMSKKCL